MGPATDTIAAIATAPGSGGIGVVRVSGPASSSIARAVLGQCPEPRRAAYLTFFEADRQVIDRGIAIYYSAPNSYTGEDVLELQGHGGPAVLQLLLKRCLDAGARQAAPGEFTQRAFLNDKLDLAQAEAVSDLISAATAEAARSAVRSLAGEFSRQIHALRDRLIELRMYVEACLDFPEEDIDFISRGDVAGRLDLLQAELQSVFAGARQGKLLRDGMHIVLVGQPNVGKSSLLNQLAGEEIAIVTPVAGTTRDTIKSAIQIRGVPLHVIDTAGLRETEDEVEQHGISRTWRALETAHAVLLLVDEVHGIGAAEQAIVARLRSDLPRLWVHNKIDLVGRAPAAEELRGEHHLYLSAKTGTGVELLREALLKIAGWQPASEGVCMARARHLDLLEQVAASLGRARGLTASAELLAEELRLAQECLNGITGEFTSDDLLGEIFGRFCIGK
ncbi:MAG: tRNA uridine-5-carboxymethylaminomethyl(34) synthesis GTPase MnmE [Methylobacterium sp.]|nr:tRNA uridine-5-carboxymethylaminomethyl(34) synthesis GTPase MnmE [Methylobacterium sp.]